jgi:hypothetical protein
MSPKSEWLSSRKQTTNVGEDVGKRNPCTVSVGTGISSPAMEINLEIPQKHREKTVMGSSSTAPGYIPQGIKFSIQ